MADTEQNVFLPPIPAPKEEGPESEPESEAVMTPITGEAGARIQIAETIPELFTTTVSLEAALEYLQKPDERGNLKISLNSNLAFTQLDFLDLLIIKSWEEYAIIQFEAAISFSRTFS
jgi:hypothetical protein